MEKTMAMEEKKRLEEFELKIKALLNEIEKIQELQDNIKLSLLEGDTLNKLKSDYLNLEEKLRTLKKTSQSIINSEIKENSKVKNR